MFACFERKIKPFWGNLKMFLCKSCGNLTIYFVKSCGNLTMFDNAKDSGSRLPKPLKTTRRLIDSPFQQADEALKCAERRQTVQKRGSARTPEYNGANTTHRRISKG